MLDLELRDVQMPVAKKANVLLNSGSLLILDWEAVPISEQKSMLQQCQEMPTKQQVMRLEKQRLLLIM